MEMRSPESGFPERVGRARVPRRRVWASLACAIGGFTTLLSQFNIGSEAVDGAIRFGKLIVRLFL